jgi:hypothetical protein
VSRTIVRLLSLASLIFFVHSVLPAQAEKRAALVIGNSTYARAPLPNAANDARLMAESLKMQGFEVFTFYNAGQKEMKRAVTVFTSALKEKGKDTVALLYYAGHGVQVKGENYLIPADANIEKEADVDIESVGVSSLMSALEQSETRLNIIVLDACRTNPFGYARSAQRGLARIDAPSGSIVAFSTAPGKAAQDGENGNSPYTAALAKAFGQAGLKIEDVFKQARVAVTEQTRGEQTPWESTSLMGDFYPAGKNAVGKSTTGDKSNAEEKAKADEERRQRERELARREDEMKVREKGVERREKEQQTAALTQPPGWPHGETPSKAPAGPLEAIRQGLASLSKAGGLIDNPSRAEEHYHNARTYETRGDYINARRSYAAFFALRLDALDPHLRYQTFLTVLEGRAGAREVYSALYEQDKRPLIEYARILLFDAPQRTEMLKTFIAAHPDFAPAYYELSREYSAARKGQQSLGDKKSESEALATFKKLHDEGKLLKYFIDKELAGQWLEDAETRTKALTAFNAAAATPVTMSASRSNSDWIVTLNMMETPRELFYRLEGEESFRSTGLMDAPNPVTGQKMPNMYFMLKASTGKTTVHVKYTDVGGEMRGPFALPFDPDQALFDSQKKMLDMTRNSWVAFRDFNGKVLVYFTQLLTSRCALQKISYGINSQATPSAFPMPTCNPKDPYAVGDGKIYIEAPGDSRFLTVQLTFKDGSKSEAIRIDR